MNRVTWTGDSVSISIQQQIALPRLTFTEHGLGEFDSNVEHLPRDLLFHRRSNHCECMNELMNDSYLMQCNQWRNTVNDGCKIVDCGLWIADCGLVVKMSRLLVVHRIKNNIDIIVPSIV